MISRSRASRRRWRRSWWAATPPRRLSVAHTPRALAAVRARPGRARRSRRAVPRQLTELAGRFPDRLQSMTDSQFFPHFVCRVAGVPASSLEELVAAESVTCYRALRELEAELGQLRAPLSEALFEAVG